MVPSFPLRSPSHGDPLHASSSSKKPKLSASTSAASAADQEISIKEESLRGHGDRDESFEAQEHRRGAEGEEQEQQTLASVASNWCFFGT